MAITIKLSLPLLTTAKLLGRAKNHWPLIVATCVPLLVLGPLLGRGYVLTYDMLFSPHWHVSLQAVHDGRALVSSLPLLVLIKLISFVLPVDIIQKLILYCIFFTAVYSLYRSLPLQSRIARLVGGLFYALNPFTYDRFMAGHWIFLLAYSLMPIALGAFYRLFTRLDLRSLLGAIVIWALLAMLSPHHLIILGLLFTAMVTAFVRTRRAAYFATAVIIGTLVLSSWWIIPLLTSHNFTNNFSLADFHAFATKPDLTYGIWLNIISLQGFWYTAWHSVKDFGNFWPLLIGLWLLPVWVGIGAAFRLYRGQQARLLWALGGVSLAAMLLAAGPNAVVGGINEWLFLHIPGLSGMRESHKLLALLTLFYAAAIAYGIDALGQLRKLWLQRSVIGLSIIMIGAMSFYMFWGAHGQLVLHRYPQSWETFYSYLERQPHQARALVLPYELYLNKTFAYRLVANPAIAYYGDRAITSQDPKLPGLRPYTVAGYERLDRAIAQRDPLALNYELRRLHISYIMFIKSDDDGKYAWARQVPHTSLITSKEFTVLQLTGP